MKKLILIITMLSTLGPSTAIAQTECNNRWTGTKPNVTFQLRNDTIYNFLIGSYGMDTIDLESGSFVINDIACSDWRYGCDRLSTITGSLSADRKKFTGTYKECVRMKVSESPDTWECVGRFFSWNAFPDTTLPPQPSLIAGDESVCIGESNPYNVDDLNASFIWSASGGSIDYPNNSSCNISWNSSGIQTITVTPYNGCGSGPGRSLTVVVNTKPAIISTTDGSRCGSGSVVLSANANEGDIVWFEYQYPHNINNNFGIGQTFNTPSLQKSKYYYVGARSNGCVTTPLVPVLAAINSNILNTQSNSRCGPGSVTLSALSSSGTINWYADSIGGMSLDTGKVFSSPSLDSTTIFYVDASFNGCTTPERKALTAQILSLPIITETTDSSHCGPGSVLLKVAAKGVSEFTWHPSMYSPTVLGRGPNFTTPVLTATTVFYVNASGMCGGVTAPITATIKTVPSITNITDSSRCGTGIVTIGATTSEGTIYWYSDSIGGTSIGSGASYTTPVLTSTMDYYVDATNDGCTSETRTEVIATVNYTDDCSGIVFSPNPTNGIIDISINIPLDGNYRINLFNSKGSLLLTKVKQTSERIFQLDLSQFPPGIYFIRVIANNDSFQSRIIRR